MDFFVLTEPGHRLGGGEPTEFLSVEPKLLGEAPRCPKCGRPVGSLPSLPPIRVALERWGEDFDDIVFGVGDELLVSERVWILQRDAGLTGLIDVGPVDVVGVKAHDRAKLTSPAYRCCRVVRGRAMLDDAASGMVRDRPWTCEECRGKAIVKRMARLVLEPGTWSGEDFFIARGLTGTIITSERVRAFCDRHAFKNILLVPALEYHFDSYPWELKKRKEN